LDKTELISKYDRHLKEDLAKFVQLNRIKLLLNDNKQQLENLFKPDALIAAMARSKFPKPKAVKHVVASDRQPVNNHEPSVVVSPIVELPSQAQTSHSLTLVPEDSIPDLRDEIPPQPSISQPEPVQIVADPPPLTSSQ